MRSHCSTTNKWQRMFLYSVSVAIVDTVMHIIFFPQLWPLSIALSVLRAKRQAAAEEKKRSFFHPKRVEWHLKYTAIKKDLLYIHSMCLSNEVEASGFNNIFISFVILSFNFVIFLSFFMLPRCHSRSPVLFLSCSISFSLSFALSLIVCLHCCCFAECSMSRHHLMRYRFAVQWW